MECRGRISFDLIIALCATPKNRMQTTVSVFAGYSKNLAELDGHGKGPTL